MFTIGDDDVGEVAVRRALVAAHPQLVLLLQHPQLQSCGSCPGCRWRERSVEPGKTKSQMSRTCYLRQRFSESLQRQRNLKQQQQKQKQKQQQQRQRSADEPEGGSGSSGGRSGGGGRYSVSRKAVGRVPTVKDVPEAVVLRGAAAFKLLHPSWEPDFLTEERLAAVAAALPAAAARVGGSDSDAMGARPAKGGDFMKRKAAERMQHLLSQLQGEDEAPAPAPLPCRGQWQQQQQQQQVAEGSASELALTQQAAGGRQAAAEITGGNAAADDQQQQQQQQQQVCRFGQKGSAFRHLARSSIAALGAGQPSQTEEERLLSQLRLLPQDVQLAFRAGLAAGLPPAAVAAALRRYHAITASGAAPADAPPADAAAVQLTAAAAAAAAAASDAPAPAADAAADAPAAPTLAAATPTSNVRPVATLVRSKRQRVEHQHDEEEGGDGEEEEAEEPPPTAHRISLRKKRLSDAH